TMDRIPYGKGKVSDNLVNTSRVMFSRYGGDSMVLPSRFPRTPEGIKLLLNFVQRILSGNRSVPLHEIEFFMARVWQFMTSCEERRLHEYEKIDWWGFIGAGERSLEYQKFFAHGFTRSLVASQAQLASTYTVGNMHLQMLLDIADPTIPTSDRLLNGPTNDVWIQPWLDYLESNGVKYHFNCDVQSIHCIAGMVRSVTIQHRQNGSTTEVTGDYYVGALPVEQMAPLITRSIIDADSQLGHLSELAKNIAWMNGIQFYLTRPLPITHGHVIYVDSPWALTSVSQAQFWSEQLSKYSDGDTGDIISVDISDWNTPGHNGKAARDCTFLEIKEEVWGQLTRSLNVEGREILRKEDLDSWFLDPDIILDPEDYEGVANTEPLLVNLKDTWRLRPDAVTEIPNFFLASDYVRTYTDLATMEGANEAARRAVNGIIAASGSKASLCSLWKLHEPEIFQPLREYDRIRWEAGLPWEDGWLSVSLSVLELVQNAVGLSSGTIGYVSSATGSVGSTIGSREIRGKSGSTEAETLLQVSRQILSMAGSDPNSTVLPAGSQKETSGMPESPESKSDGSATAVLPRQRGRIRIVQKP
ncbi:MAG: FAD-dependent oxidoreductase, partial [Nitrospirales bacterium]